MSEPVFDLLPLTWQFFSVVMTLLAVLVALFLPFVRDKRNVRVTAMIGFLVTQTYQSGDHLSATATNLSKHKITLTTWGLKYKKKTGKKFAMIIPEIPQLLPKTLEYMDYLTVWAASPLEEKDEIENVFFTDSAGKYWFLSPRRKKRLQKELRGYKPK
jgi:hypothetical protein